MRRCFLCVREVFVGRRYGLVVALFRLGDDWDDGIIDMTIGLIHYGSLLSL